MLCVLCALCGLFVERREINGLMIEDTEFQSVIPLFSDIDKEKLSFTEG